MWEIEDKTNKIDSLKETEECPREVRNVSKSA